MRDETRRAIEMYVQHGISPGGFLEAALENNFVEAVGRADAESLKEIDAIATYLQYQIPGNAWGSREIVRKWSSLKRRDVPELGGGAG